jgi:lipopolysaccharide biosynthesis glycosyltransferase
MKYPVCCITDEEYAQSCGVMLCSLLENNKNKIFVIHILISELCDDTKEKLNKIVLPYGSECVFHQINESKLAGVQFSTRRPLYTAYFKLLLSSVIDRETGIILYIDSDMVVNGGITHIFDLDIRNYALAAVEAPPIEYDHRMQLSLPYDAQYFNSGLMLVNLDYWRKHDSEEHLLCFAKKKRYVFFHDQDALNMVFRNQWFSLHPIWNKLHMCINYHPYFANQSDKYIFKKQPLIIHYAADFKPWYSFHFLPYKRVYYRFLEMTPWKGTKPLKFRNNKAAYLYIFIHACRGTPLHSILLWMLQLRDKIRG